MKTIAIEGISFGYSAELIFRDFSLVINPGEFLGIIGPNGSGKSTLLRLLAGILKPMRGLVKVGDSDIARFSRRQIAQMIALVPQESLFAFDWKVKDVVMMGRNPFLGLWGRPREQDWRVVERAMVLTDTIDLADKDINAISTGEKQRVVLARALAQEPEILLLDEATSHLDISHRVAILRILKMLNQEGKTIIFVSHDLNEAGAFCSRVALLRRGEMLACDYPEKVFRVELICAAYGLNPVITVHPVTGRPQILLPPG